jgi:hypothetical protein
MPLNRKTLMVAAFAVALCAAGFATPAQAIDNTCHPYCWTLTYPQDCLKTCKLPNGSQTTCGQYLGHPQCGWASAGLIEIEVAGADTLVDEAVCASREVSQTAVEAPAPAEIC